MCRFTHTSTAQVIGLVHNMTLAPALHCVVSIRVTWIELICIPVLWVQCSDIATLSNFWLSWIAILNRISSDTHGAILWTRPYTCNIPQNCKGYLPSWTVASCDCSCTIQNNCFHNTHCCCAYCAQSDLLVKTTILFFHLPDSPVGSLLLTSELLL